MARELTHIDERGRARMVDVSDKAPSRRVAVATGRLRMDSATRERMVRGDVPKGNATEVARIAGIQAAKRTAELVPLCHPLPLSHVDVEIEPDEDGLLVRATAATTGPTGVEMEALTAVTVALLTLYDMCKAIDRGLEICAVRLEEKRGGRSGTWTRSE